MINWDLKLPQLGSELQEQAFKGKGKIYIQGVQSRVLLQNLELLYVQKKLDSVFIYLNRASKIESLPLPYGIRPGMTLLTIISILGEPSKKIGGVITDIEIEYKWLGLSIVFQSKCWVPLCKIDYLYYYRKEGVPCCGACGKQLAEDKCQGCERVYYCSMSCRAEHWKAHKSHCSSQY